MLPTDNPSRGVSSVPRTETAFWAHLLGFARLVLEALGIRASTPLWRVLSYGLWAAFPSPAAAPGWLLPTTFLRGTLLLKPPMAPQCPQDKPLSTALRTGLCDPVSPALHPRSNCSWPPQLRLLCWLQWMHPLFQNIPPPPCGGGSAGPFPHGTGSLVLSSGLCFCLPTERRCLIYWALQ